MSDGDHTPASEIRKPTSHRFIDLTGRTFGRWTVVEFSSRTKSGTLRWKCRCSCGTERIVHGGDLTHGKSRGCRCDKVVDLSGQRFGMLAVVELAEKDERGDTRWQCRCDCGTTKVIEGRMLTRKSGPYRSCGCRIGVTHGGTGTRLHGTWRNMKVRCYDESSEYYHNYGGRGIKICDEWVNDFAAFREWAESHGYKDDLTIERREGSGDYRPDNCCWATMKEQGRNTRKNLKITAFGETKIAIEWSEDPRCQAPYRSILTRLRAGWDVELAITTPTRPIHGKRLKEAK